MLNKVTVFKVLFCTAAVGFVSLQSYGGEIEKQMAESSEKICQSSFDDFARHESLRISQLENSDKNLLVNSCTVRSFNGSSVCAKAFLTKLAAKIKGHKLNAQIRADAKENLQPKYEACLAASQQRSIEGINEAGKLFLDGKKEEARARAENWLVETPKATL